MLVDADIKLAITGGRPKMNTKLFSIVMSTKVLITPTQANRNIF